MINLRQTKLWNLIIISKKAILSIFWKGLKKLKIINNQKKKKRKGVEKHQKVNVGYLIKK